MLFSLLYNLHKRYLSLLLPFLCRLNGNYLPWHLFDASGVEITAQNHNRFSFARMCQIVDNLAFLAVKACDAAGVAAFNIWGATLHSALKLPVEKAHHRAAASATYKALQGEALEDLQQAWRDVQYLIVDEISMVSNTVLKFASKRLCVPSIS